jgi:hypothetical protein
LTDRHRDAVEVFQSFSEWEIDEECGQLWEGYFDATRGVLAQFAPLNFGCFLFLRIHVEGALLPAGFATHGLQIEDWGSVGFRCGEMEFGEGGPYDLQVGCDWTQDGGVLIQIGEQLNGVVFNLFIELF